MEILFYLLLVIFLFGVVVFGQLYLILLLAKNDIFFTMVQEGHFKIVVSRGGAFLKVVLQKEQYDMQGDYIKKSNINNTKSWIGDLFKGVHWIGIPGFVKIHKCDLRQSKLSQDDRGRWNVANLKGKDVDQFSAQENVYYAKLKEAENRDFIPVDIELLFTIRIINPKNAIFRNNEWLDVVLGELLSGLRQFVGQNSWVDLQNSNIKKRLTENMQAISLSHLGVELLAANILSMTMGGSQASVLQEASTKKYVAEKYAEVTGIQTEAEVDKINKICKAIRDSGKAGELIMSLEALKEVAKYGNTVILPSGLGNLSGMSANEALLAGVLNQIKKNR